MMRNKARQERLVETRDVAHQLVKIIGRRILPEIQRHMSQVPVLVHNQRFFAVETR